MLRFVPVAHEIRHLREEGGQFSLAGRRDLALLHRRFLSRATGRHLEITDDPEVEEILGQTRAQGNGLRPLVVACLKSEVFRSR